MITLTPEALEAMISNAYARGLADAQSKLIRAKTPSERAREYRERKKLSTQATLDKAESQNVTQNHAIVTERHENVTNITENVTECDEVENSPSPSSLPPVPPNPAPPPAIYASAKGTSNEVEKSNIRPTKRAESAKALAEKEAQLVSDLDLPTQILANPDLLAAWQAWHQWRVRLAITGKVGGKRYPWTVGAAQRAINQITKVTSTIAIQAIYKAIDHGWTGIHFENETTGNYQHARGSSSTGARRTDTLNAPDRYSTPTEGSSTNGRRGNSALDQDMEFEL